MRALFSVAFTLALVATSSATAQNLVVPIDHSVRLNIRGQAASVVVGNPTVADVTVVDSHTLFVSGRGYGETDIVILDHAGQTLYSGDVIVGANGVGRVSVYRGSDRTDLACAPGCSVSTRSPTAPSKEGAAAGPSSAAPANPLAGLAAGAGGLAAGAAGAASAGMSAVARPG